MNPFNHNIRFLRKKKGFSQQKLGDLLGVTRGMIASYEEETNASDEFKGQLAQQFDLNLSKFLTFVMDEYNYSSFFNSFSQEETSQVNEPAAEYGEKSLLDLIELLPASDIKEALRAKAIKISEKDASQKEKIIALHEYKDELLKILKDEGYSFD